MLVSALAFAPLAAAAEPSKMAASGESVGIVADTADGRLATDLADLLAHERMQVLPVFGRGPMQDVDELLHAKGIGFAILPSDIFADLRRSPLLPEAMARIRLVLKIYDKQFHLLARNDIREASTLTGRKVGFGTRGSANALTATTVFEALGIQPEPVYGDEQLQLAQLRNGQLAAVALIAAAPIVALQDINREQGPHFLAVPHTARLSAFYQPAALRPEEYPLLVGEGEAGRGAPVPTVALSMVIAAYDFASGSPREAASAHFVRSLFANFPALLAPSRDPRWRQADRNAALPGWIKYSPAAVTAGAPTSKKLGTRAPAPLKSSENPEKMFQDFLRWQHSQAEETGRSDGGSGTSKDPGELFQEFLRWQRTHD